MASIFTKIINREIPAYIVAENNDFIAFLDVDDWWDYKQEMEYKNGDTDR